MRISDWSSDVCSSDLLDTSEAYDVPMMLAEIRTMNTMLTAIDGKLQHSFATPCGQHLAGGVDYLPELRASGLVRYTRSAGWPGGEDPMDVPCRWRSEEHTSELQSLMRISYAVFCLKKKTKL